MGMENNELSRLDNVFTWRSVAPIEAFSGTEAEYCLGSKTGVLSFSSRTVTTKVELVVLGGFPLSLAATC